MAATAATAATAAKAPEAEFRGLDYTNDAGVYRELLDKAVDVNSRDCTNSSHVDFLYLSTIRGGRKKNNMKMMNAGGCGCGSALVGGGARRRLRGGNNDVNNAVNYSSDANTRAANAINESIDYTNNANDPNNGASNGAFNGAFNGSSNGSSNNTYNDTSGPSNSITSLGDIAITGGCFTCKKGVKNITHIYSTIHIIIPTLYTKYKKGISLKSAKVVKKSIKKAR